MGMPPTGFYTSREELPPFNDSKQPSVEQASELDCTFENVFGKIKFLFPSLEENSEGITGEVKPIGNVQINADEKELHQLVNNLIAAYTLAVAFEEDKSCFKVKEWTNHGVKIVDKRDTAATLPLGDRHIQDGQLNLSQVIKDLLPLMSQAQKARINRGTCLEGYSYDETILGDSKQLPGYFNSQCEWIQPSDLDPEMRARDHLLRDILVN